MGLTIGVEILTMSPKPGPGKGYIYKGDSHCKRYSAAYNRGNNGYRGPINEPSEVEYCIGDSWRLI